MPLPVAARAGDGRIARLRDSRLPSPRSPWPEQDWAARRRTDPAFAPRNSGSQVAWQPPPRVIRGPRGSPCAPAHDPYVPDSVDMAEFTWSAVLVGAVLGIVFGASSLYLVLKVGMTVSASIPVAVLSITLFRRLLAHLRHPPGHDSGKQHRADHRLGRRVDRLRRGRDDPRPAAAGLRHGT